MYSLPLGEATPESMLMAPLTKWSTLSLSSLFPKTSVQFSRAYVAGSKKAGLPSQQQDNFTASINPHKPRPVDAGRHFRSSPAAGKSTNFPWGINIFTEVRLQQP